MTSYVKSSLVSTCILCVIFCNVLCRAATQKEVPTESTSAAPSTDAAQTTSEESTTDETLTVATEITSELPLTSEISLDVPQDATPTPSPDKPPSAALPVPTSAPAKPVPQPPGPKTTPTIPKASGPTKQQSSEQSPTKHTTLSPKTKQSKSPEATTPDKRGDAADLGTTTTKEAQVATTVLPTTPNVQTRASVKVTPQKIATTQAATTTEPKETTPKPKPLATEPKRSVKPIVLTTTPQSKTATPVRSVLTTRTPKTERNQPEGSSEDHEDHHVPTSNPGLDKSKNDTGWFNNFSHNTLVSKLMLPVILGIVAAVIIVCFAYGIRACKKNRSRGNRKMMHNGKVHDHEMGGNLDRMKLLADSSEDEF